MTDLMPLAREPFATAVEKLGELLSHSNRAFLIGAGCSRCAGLPLMSDLTCAVSEDAKLAGSTRTILAAVEKLFAGSEGATIEDYMSEIVDHLAITQRREERRASEARVVIGGSAHTPEELHHALEDIKQAIARCITDKRPKLGTHWDFVRTVHRTLRTGKSIEVAPVDYYVLNYDTLIEDALGLECIPYVDGLRGGATAWWDVSSFEAPSVSARVLKIHGSIDWCELDGHQPLPRRLRPSLESAGVPGHRLMIWPAATKYREAQQDPYAQLVKIMREKLRPRGSTQLVLTICGYRFADAHVNIEIDRALRDTEKNLTVLAFTEQDPLDGQLRAWHDDPEVRDQVRIHAKRGFYHGNTQTTCDEDLPWWTFETITRLLGGERW